MPDNTLSEPRPAGLARRLGAVLYDSMALFALFFFSTWLLVALSGGAFAPGHPLLRGFLFAIGCGFFGWFWTHGGQTLGMRAWRIRLVDADGGPVRWPRAMLRCIVALFSWICFGAGFWTALFDRQHRTWHDRVSETYLQYS